MNEFAAASAIVAEALTLFILALATTAIVTGLIVVAAEVVTDLVERWLGPGNSDEGQP
ncbi:MAG: hypothetical protein WCZ28_06100 [Burkholderiaceae bacterium]